MKFQVITHNISTDSVDFGQLAKINRICWNVVSDQLKICEWSVENVRTQHQTNYWLDASGSMDTTTEIKGGITLDPRDTGGKSGPVQRISRSQCFKAAVDALRRTAPDTVVVLIQFGTKVEVIGYIHRKILIFQGWNFISPVYQHSGFHGLTPGDRNQDWK